MDSNDAIAPQADMFAAMGEMKEELQKLGELAQKVIALARDFPDLIKRIEALEQAATRSPP